MLCGLYEIDVTPKLGQNLPGYFVGRPASGVRDPLYARALACSNDGGDAFVLVNIDTISCDPRTSERVRTRFEEMTGISGDRVMVSTTHTHTGGPVDAFVPGTFDLDYMLWMADRAADAAVMAWNARRPARLGFGRAHEETISFNRRYKLKNGAFATNPGFRPDEIECAVGGIDPEVSVIKIEDTDGRLIGVVTNFACHLDTVGGNRFCADFPGELARIIKRVYGQEVVSLFLTGACGNINHYDFMHHTTIDDYRLADPPHYVRMGRTLAGDVIRALAWIVAEDCDEIAVANDTFQAEIRTPTPEAIAEAEALLKAHPYEPVYSRENDTSAGPPDLVQRHFARSLLAVADIKEKKTTVPVQVARIGKAAIAGMPCELFVEFGLDVKARSGFEYTLISTLTNDHFGYLAVREAFEQGGYETTISGDTMMAPQTGYDLADTAVALCKKLR